MKTNAAAIESLSSKLVTSFFVLVCIVVGIVGLVIPIIPGLLFLAIAAVILAKRFPSMNGWLRQNRTLRRHLDTTDGLARLTLADKLKYAALLCAKTLLDTIAFIGALATKLRSRA